MADEIRNMTRGGRFEFGSMGRSQSQTASIKELLAEINYERNSTKGNAIDVRSLETTLDGVARITGRDISRSEIQPRPIVDLKTIKRLYLAALENRVHLFNLIDPPHLLNKSTSEFRDAYPAPRNEIATGVVSDLLSNLSKEIAKERLAFINQTIINLPELLLMVEKQDAAIGAALKMRCEGDLVALAAVYSELAARVNTYQPQQKAASNPLNEAIYTHLRTLRYAHFALGFGQASELAAINHEITPICHELEMFCYGLSKSMGRPVLLTTPIISLSEFPDFVKSRKPTFITLIERATGLETQRLKLARISELAKRLLNLYCYFHLGERNTKSVLLSAWDCVAALCTIRHEQFANTRHAPYWPTQQAQGDNLLRHLLPSRRDNKKPSGHRTIDELYSADYVPHVINQILYQRFCSMQSTLVELGEIHKARMAFRVARHMKLAECFRSNDVDHVNDELARFDAYCQVQALKCERVPSLTAAGLFETLNEWVHQSPA